MSLNKPVIPPKNEETPDSVLDAKIDGVHKKSGVMSILRRIVFTICLIYIIFGLIFGLGYVQGNSMHPVMDDGDIILYFRLHRNFKIGDIVVFDQNPGDFRVKRVVGTGGDVLDIDENGVLTVNGASPDIEVFYETSAAPGGISFPYTVPEDELVLMGDKRDTSVDSRATGSVKAGDIKGVVIFLVRTGT